MVIKKNKIFTAEHPLGLYSDRIMGTIYKETYKITKTNLDDPFGSIEITRLRDGEKSIVEPKWFESDTGRSITWN